jgi:hypothetical protein
MIDRWGTERAVSRRYVAMLDRRFTIAPEVLVSLP